MYRVYAVTTHSPFILVTNATFSDHVRTQTIRTDDSR